MKKIAGSIPAALLLILTVTLASWTPALAHSVNSASPQYSEMWQVEQGSTATCPFHV